MKLDMNESNFKFGSIMLHIDNFIQLLDYCNEEYRIKGLNFTYKMPLSGFYKMPLSGLDKVLKLSFWFGPKLPQEGKLWPNDFELKIKGFD